MADTTSQSVDTHSKKGPTETSLSNGNLSDHGNHGNNGNCSNYENQSINGYQSNHGNHRNEDTTGLRKRGRRLRPSPGAGLGIKRPRRPESIKPVRKDSNKVFLLDSEEGPLFQELCQHGIAGMSAIAAISSCRRRDPSAQFERSPEARKNLYAQYVQQLQDLLLEFSMRVGLQAAVVVYEPSEVNSTNAMKILGTSPIKEYVSKYAHHIQRNTHRKLKQMHKRVASKSDINFKSVSSILPPVLIHGIPTSVEELTQAQLRSFLRLLLCEAEGRKTPQWHNPRMAPDWWPLCVPWQNIKTDQRLLDSKRQRCWSDCLRHAVYKCYLFYNQTHLLPEFDMDMYRQHYECWELDTGLRSEPLPDTKPVRKQTPVRPDTRPALLLSAFPSGFLDTSSDEECKEGPVKDLLYLANIPLDFDSWLVSDQDILPRQQSVDGMQDPVCLEEAFISNDFVFSNSDPDSLLCKRVSLS